MAVTPRSLILLFGLVAVAAAHMELLFPPGIKSQWDPQTVETDKDYSMTIPINSTMYPCKGYATPENIAKLHPVATLVSGQPFTWKLHGTASHDGGSCQVGISYDGMVTNTVLASWIGGCPLNPSYTFVVPQLPASGKALFTWQWWNREGNREEYQVIGSLDPLNCAVVSVVGTATTFVGPLVYRANSFADNTCQNTEGIEDVFPNPGTQVVYGGIYNNGIPKATISFSDCKYNQNVAVTIAATGTGITGQGTAKGVASGSIDPATHSLSGNVAVPSPASGPPQSPSPPPVSTPPPSASSPPAPSPASKPPTPPSNPPSSQLASNASNKAASSSPRPTQSAGVLGTSKPTSSSQSPSGVPRSTSRPLINPDYPPPSPSVDSTDSTPDQANAVNPGRLVVSSVGGIGSPDSSAPSTAPLSNLSTLAKILLGVGSLVVLSLIIFIAFIYMRRRRQRLARASLHDQVESATKPIRTAPKRKDKYEGMPEDSDMHSSSGYDRESRSEESSDEEIERTAASGKGRR